MTWIYNMRFVAYLLVFIYKKNAFDNLKTYLIMTYIIYTKTFMSTKLGARTILVHCLSV